VLARQASLTGEDIMALAVRFSGDPLENCPVTQVFLFSHFT